MGSGRSKKLARINAAKAALLGNRTKRTSDSLSMVFPHRNVNDGQINCVSSVTVLDISKQKPQNAVVLLNELLPDIVYKLKSRTGPDHDPLFTVTVAVVRF